MSMQYIFDLLDNDFSSGSMGVSNNCWPHSVQTPDESTPYRQPFWETRETFVSALLLVMSPEVVHPAFLDKYV